MSTRTPVIAHDTMSRFIRFSRPGGRTVRASRGHLEHRLQRARGTNGLVGVNGLDLDEQAITELLELLPQDDPADIKHRG